MFLKKQYMRFLILRSHTRMIQKKKKKKKKKKTGWIYMTTSPHF